MDYNHEKITTTLKKQKNKKEEQINNNYNTKKMFPQVSYAYDVLKVIQIGSDTTWKKNENNKKYKELEVKTIDAETISQHVEKLQKFVDTDDVNAFIGYCVGVRFMPRWEDFKVPVWNSKFDSRTANATLKKYEVTTLDSSKLLLPQPEQSQVRDQRTVVFSLQQEKLKSTYWPGYDDPERGSITNLKLAKNAFEMSPDEYRFKVYLKLLFVYCTKFFGTAAPEAQIFRLKEAADKAYELYNPIFPRDFTTHKVMTPFHASGYWCKYMPTRIREEETTLDLDFYNLDEEEFVVEGKKMPVYRLTNLSSSPGAPYANYPPLLKGALTKYLRTDKITKSSTYRSDIFNLFLAIDEADDYDNVRALSSFCINNASPKKEVYKYSEHLTKQRSIYVMPSLANLAVGLFFQMTFENMPSLLTHPTSVSLLGVSLFKGGLNRVMKVLRERADADYNSYAVYADNIYYVEKIGDGRYTWVSLDVSKMESHHTSTSLWTFFVHLILTFWIKNDEMFINANYLKIMSYLYMNNCLGVAQLGSNQYYPPGLLSGVAGTTFLNTSLSILHAQQYVYYRRQTLKSIVDKKFINPYAETPGFESPDEVVKFFNLSGLAVKIEKKIELNFNDPGPVLWELDLLGNDGLYVKKNSNSSYPPASIQNPAVYPVLAYTRFVDSLMFEKSTISSEVKYVEGTDAKYIRNWLLATKMCVLALVTGQYYKEFNSILMARYNKAREYLNENKDVTFTITPEAMTFLNYDFIETLTDNPIWPDREMYQSLYLDTKPSHLKQVPSPTGYKDTKEFQKDFKHFPLPELIRSESSVEYLTKYNYQTLDKDKMNQYLKRAPENKEPRSKESKKEVDDVSTQPTTVEVGKKVKKKKKKVVFIPKDLVPVKPNVMPTERSAKLESFLSADDAPKFNKNLTLALQDILSPEEIKLLIHSPKSYTKFPTEVFKNMSEEETNGLYKLLRSEGYSDRIVDKGPVRAELIKRFPNMDYTYLVAMYPNFVTKDKELNDFLARVIKLYGTDSLPY